MPKRDYSYEMVRRDLVRRIEEGEYLYNGFLPSEKELAEQHQVSSVTVRKALELMAADGYILKRQGKGSQVVYRQGETPEDTQEKTIGFFFPSGRGEAFRKKHSFYMSYMSLYSYIEKNCRKRNYRVVYLTIRDLDDFIRLTKQYHFSGAFFMSKIPEAVVRYAYEMRLPAVTVNEKFPGLPCITMDNVGGGYIAVKHLLDCGHRKIMFVTGPQKYFTSEDRLLGAAKAMEERGLPVTKENMVTADWSFDGGYAAMREILDRPRETWPTAVFVFNEDMSLGVTRALSERRLSVPDDVSVISFDGTFGGKYLTDITTIDGSIRLMAETASTVLINQVNGYGVGGGVTILIPVQLKEYGAVKRIMNVGHTERGSVINAGHAVRVFSEMTANKI